MGGKYSWIVLFVTLQISIVLCRSTEKPKEEDKAFHAGPILLLHGQASAVKNADQYFAENFGEPTPESPVPRKMSNDVYIDRDIYSTYDTIMTSYAIAAIIIGVFSIVSLILGCIMMACCKKPPRRGFVVNSNAGVQTGATVPGAPGNVQQTQHYPPSYGQTQQQNVYPTKY